MTCFSIGPIPFWVSPTAVMKCFVGLANWRARGTRGELEEYDLFREEFFPFLIALPNDMPLGAFCGATVEKIDKTIRYYGLSLATAMQFTYLLKNTLRSQENRDAYSWYALMYEAWLHEWLASPDGRVGCLAVERAVSWGVQPLRACLAAVSSFGTATYGKYVPWLGAVCVQMDTICAGSHPGINFIETLLHEEIHAVIHNLMGKDLQRRELVWLNELAAVLTSQYAVDYTAQVILDRRGSQAMLRALATLRDEQRYGDLARAVVNDTGNPLLGWWAWQAIAQLPEEQKRNYATNGIITPLLQRLGWEVAFPYYYSDKYVTVFV